MTRFATIALIFREPIRYKKHEGFLDCAIKLSLCSLWHSRYIHYVLPILLFQNHFVQAFEIAGSPNVQPLITHYHSERKFNKARESVAQSYSNRTILISE